MIAPKAGEWFLAYEDFHGDWVLDPVHFDTGSTFTSESEALAAMETAGSGATGLKHMVVRVVAVAARKDGAAKW